MLDHGNTQLFGFTQRDVADNPFLSYFHSYFTTFKQFSPIIPTSIIYLHTCENSFTQYTCVSI